MKIITLDGDGLTGEVAIWEGEDDGPRLNPLDHLADGRLRFHSSLDYPKVIRQETINVTFPARQITDNAQEYRANYNLFAHGRPGIPWVLGSFRVGGVDVAATANVPVQRAVGAPTPWYRWLSIGANATHVTV